MKTLGNDFGYLMITTSNILLTISIYSLKLVPSFYIRSDEYQQSFKNTQTYYIPACMIFGSLVTAIILRSKATKLNKLYTVVTFIYVGLYILQLVTLKAPIILSIVINSVLAAEAGALLVLIFEISVEITFPNR